MSHTVSYKDLPRWQADDKAIEDARAYVGEKVWKAIREAADECLTIRDLKGFNMSVAFAGVQGYPFHAICRRYCLEAYRAWMADGDDSTPTDAWGFSVKEATC